MNTIQVFLGFFAAMFKTFFPGSADEPSSPPMPPLVSPPPRQDHMMTKALVDVDDIMRKALVFVIIYTVFIMVATTATTITITIAIHRAVAIAAGLFHQLDMCIENTVDKLITSLDLIYVMTVRSIVIINAFAMRILANILFLVYRLRTMMRDIDDYLRALFVQILMQVFDMLVRLLAQLDTCLNIVRMIMVGDTAIIEAVAVFAWHRTAGFRMRIFANILYLVDRLQTKMRSCLDYSRALLLQIQMKGFDMLGRLRVGWNDLLESMKFPEDAPDQE